MYCLHRNQYIKFVPYYYQNQNFEYKIINRNDPDLVKEVKQNNRWIEYEDYTNHLRLRFNYELQRSSISGTRNRDECYSKCNFILGTSLTMECDKYIIQHRLYNFCSYTTIGIEIYKKPIPSPYDIQRTKFQKLEIKNNINTDIVEPTCSSTINYQIHNNKLIIRNSPGRYNNMNRNAIYKSNKHFLKGMNIDKVKEKLFVNSLEELNYKYVIYNILNESLNVFIIINDKFLYNKRGLFIGYVS